MQIKSFRETKNGISKIYFAQPFLRLCESIFAYGVNRSSTYLCTPVGAVSLSACVSLRLQRVEKYFFNTLKSADKKSTDFFAYGINRSSTYFLCVVGAVSLSEFHRISVQVILLFPESQSYLCLRSILL